MDDRIMFATDYPHWDFDSPGQALPRALGDELRGKILGRERRAPVRARLTTTPRRVTGPVGRRPPA